VGAQLSAQSLGSGDRMTRVPAILILLVGATAFFFWLTRSRAGAEGTARVFRVGQEWSFVGRSSDPEPTLIIVRVETLPRIGEVIHISVRGVRIRNSHAAEGYVDTLPHLPFSPAALQRSVTRLVADSVTLPDFKPGYEEWRRAQGGAFTVSVREALDLAEQAVK